MKIAVKEVGKEFRLLDTQRKYRDVCVKSFTGKRERAEYIPLNEDGTLCLGVNEMGLRLGLPTNFLLRTTNPYWPIQKMVGTVVFVRKKPVDPLAGEIWDYEVDDLTEEDLDFIRRILDKELQAELSKDFVDYGKGHAIFERIRCFK